MPSVGTLEVYRPPKGDHIRVDDGFEEGMQVPIQYDPMLSKLITYGKTRNEAIQLMIDAISRFEVEGVRTTLPFGKFVFEHEAFRSGNFNTHFVKEYYSAEKMKAMLEAEATIAAQVALQHYLKDLELLRLPKN
jgi:propionyl-CoA carboxylase alpha chain